MLATFSAVVGQRWGSMTLPEPKIPSNEGYGDRLVVCSHPSFLNSGETITIEKYCQQIDKMYRKLKHMCPALVSKKVLIFLHNYARPHVSVKTRQKLHELCYETLDRPRYSPDTSPTDLNTHLNIWTSWLTVYTSSGLVEYHVDHGLTGKQWKKLQVPTSHPHGWYQLGYSVGKRKRNLKFKSCLTPRCYWKQICSSKRDLLEKINLTSLL